MTVEQSFKFKPLRARLFLAPCMALALAIAILLPAKEAQAQDIRLVESYGAYCNDVYFGSDGGCIDLAAHGVAHDSLYASRTRHFLGEAGIVGQFTVVETVRGTVLASCTSKPYRGALDPDCKASVRIGILY